MRHETKLFQKEGKRYMKRKGFAVFAAAALIAAIIFMGANILFFIAKWYPYRQCMNSMDTMSRDEGIRNEGHYLYKVKMPTYLGFDSGFLHVGPGDEELPVVTSEGDFLYEGNQYVDLVIRPQVFGPTQMSVSVLTKEGLVHVPINSDVQYLPRLSGSEEENERCRAILRENEDQIRELIDAAEEKWPSVFE